MLRAQVITTSAGGRNGPGFAVLWTSAPAELVPSAPPAGGVVATTRTPLGAVAGRPVMPNLVEARPPLSIQRSPFVEGMNGASGATDSKEITMGRVVVHEFITLDGVIDNPAWSMEYGYDPKMGGAIGRIMQSSKALLMGRNTYELFAPTWSTRTAAEDPGAPFMNESPKYVVSSTLEHAGWNNSTILGAYDAKTIRSLKQRIEGDVYVSGSWNARACDAGRRPGG